MKDFEKMFSFLYLYYPCDIVKVGSYGRVQRIIVYTLVM